MQNDNFVFVLLLKQNLASKAKGTLLLIIGNFIFHLNFK
jgi:hypothetical protein